MQSTTLLSFPVHLATADDGMARVREALDNEENLHIVTINPEMLMQGQADPELGSILKNAGLIIPDGAGVVWALRSRGYKNLQRLPGIEFSEKLLTTAAAEGLRVAVIGAEETVLNAAINNLTQRFNGLNVVYSHHGFFKADSEDETAIAEACAHEEPDIVLIALGVPRQEKWIAKYKHFFHGSVFAGVGGSLDIWSGTKRRAPQFFLDYHLEWLYRITSEPWRIKRTYKTLPMFVVKVLLSRGK